MGNLCSGQPPNNANGQPAGQPAGPVGSKPAAARKEPGPMDVIEQALTDAQRELDKNRGRDFNDTYKVSKLVGHGAFAKVMICSHKDTHEKYAVKTVQKNAEEPAKQREGAFLLAGDPLVEWALTGGAPRVRRAGILKEIAIMRLLCDHPNTIKLYEVYEDKESYHLILELCSGGELFDQIIAKGHFSEKDASEKMHCLLDFIAYAHSKHIIHRDLKPENILLSDKTPHAVLKVIDFGTSDFCLEGQRLSQKFGTPYYVAPEVLKKDYDKSADIWSAGVIMFILLCGYPPFGGKTDAKILQRVQAGQYSFDGKEWEVVTEAAKDMISRMLVMDLGKRATAKELLQHRWFQVAATAPAAALGAHMVKRLRAFAGMSRMKRLALVVLARTLTDNDVKRLRFEKMMQS
ncbi:Calcium-dependent protein kinase 32 [Tetrabaena socialis]|uniref:Calcium-dependent protein kinase 32 n=1 Tax=Tetrabaena socialis TaxID=47790 RepID=A0A2J7ZV58_9CHLO|nr:Calcium-dependent protein kinase 32 [Tetrabaena socialis]|eukprot:PNH04139.1 Calcium-dependent protein kinase 32 [Tetrabaena socialis]